MSGRRHHQQRRSCLKPPGERAEAPDWRQPQRRRRLVLLILILVLHGGFFVVLKNGLLQRNVLERSSNVVTATIFPPDVTVTVIPSAPTAAAPAVTPLPPARKPLPPKPRQPERRPAAPPSPAPTAPSAKLAQPVEAASSSGAPATRPASPTAPPAPTDPNAPAVPAPAPASAGRPALLKTITSGVRYLQLPQPVYPAQAKRMGEQGRVVLRVAIDENGRAGRIEIEISSGFVQLDEAAIDAVRRARFQPHVEEGRPIAVDVMVPITFKLDD